MHKVWLLDWCNCPTSLGLVAMMLFSGGVNPQATPALAIINNSGVPFVNSSGQILVSSS